MTRRLSELAMSVVRQVAVNEPVSKLEKNIIKVFAWLLPNSGTKFIVIHSIGAQFVEQGSF